MIYQVWRVDCEACGTIIEYGEDESTVPDFCEECGVSTSDPDALPENRQYPNYDPDVWASPAHGLKEGPR